ncbi:MAG: hypothetical protein Q4C04_04160 [Clostridia bacterium]|nr:hypothetical protein [Clostridia bacterium]
MKKILIFAICSLMLLSLGCQPGGGQGDTATEAPTEPTQEPVVEGTAIPAESLPVVWENENWNDTAMVATIDLDGDGVEETLRFEGDEDASEVACRFYVNDLSVTLEFFMPSRVMLCDLLSDGITDILVEGDMASSDFYTYQLLYDGTSLTILSVHYAWIEEYTQFGMVMGEIVDMLGTWSTIRLYTTQNGVLIPATSVLINQETDMSEDAEFSRVLTLIKELPVTTLSGESTTLPVGTKLIPAAFVRGSYLDILTSDGVQYRLEVTYGESEWECLIDGAPESEYFEELFYAG